MEHKATENIWCGKPKMKLRRLEGGAHGDGELENVLEKDAARGEVEINTSIGRKICIQNKR